MLLITLKNLYELYFCQTNLMHTLGELIRSRLPFIENKLKFLNQGEEVFDIDFISLCNWLEALVRF